MINDLLNMLLPDRTNEKDVETFRRGLVRLLASRPSDHDPINRRAPKPTPTRVRRSRLVTMPEPIAGQSKNPS